MIFICFLQIIIHNTPTVVFFQLSTRVVTEFRNNITCYYSIDKQKSNTQVFNKKILFKSEKINTILYVSVKYYNYVENKKNIDIFYLLYIKMSNLYVIVIYRDFKVNCEVSIMKFYESELRIFV